MNSEVIIIIIIIATIYVITILLIQNINIIKLKRNLILIGIREVNKIYKELFTTNDIFIKFTQSTIIVLSEMFLFISLYIIAFKNLKEYLTSSIRYDIFIVIILLIFLIIHYLMGYILLISTKLHKFMYRSEEESLQADFLLSYFLTSTYLTVLILFPYQLHNYIFIGLIGISICYVLNLKILFKVMKNPKSIKLSEEDKNSFFRVLIAAAIIVTMIIVNLFLGVCLVNSIGTEAFSNNPSHFDLFYYTIVTFTTIGFGDIIPLSVPSKIIAIVISITSIICITVFLGSIFSYGDRIH